MAPLGSFRISKCILVMMTVFMLTFISLSSALGSAPIHENGDMDLVAEDMPETGYEPELDVYVVYDESYWTRNYDVWEEYEKDNDTITLARDSVVVRRGSSLEIKAPAEAEITVKPSRGDMTSIGPIRQIDNNTFKTDLPRDGTVGSYTIETNWPDGEHHMDLLVVHDPRETSLSDEKIRAYTYDEDSTRDEKAYLVPAGGGPQEADLRLYGDDAEGMPAMYEFALRAVAGTSEPEDAAVRLARVVAQRSDAVPAPLSPQEPPNQPFIRDASEILFGEGSGEEGTLYHDEREGYMYLDYTGLELEDAEILAENDETLESIRNPTEVERTKQINAWCDETSIALTALLRAVGIPSRIVSAHPRPEYIDETELMGHFTVEVWFEDSLYDTTWREGEGDWYVVDADAWNARWFVAEPTYWSFIGESFSARRNYGIIGDLYFRDNPDYKYMIDLAYVFGTETDELPSQVDVTEHYYEGEGMHMEYGSVEKYIGRGGGDSYILDIEETSRLSIESTGGTNPRIYVNQEKYPALSITYEGYPPTTPNSNYTGEEIILSEGRYYVCIYAPEEGDSSIEGNYGRYPLKLEKTPDATPAAAPDKIENLEFERDERDINLDWTPPEDRGAPILYYKVYRDGEVIGRATSSSYVDDQGVGYGRYDYQVAAVNAMGESETSEKVEVSIGHRIQEDPTAAVGGITFFTIWILVYFVLTSKKDGKDPD